MELTLRRPIFLGFWSYLVVMPHPPHGLGFGAFNFLKKKNSLFGWLVMTLFLLYHFWIIGNLLQLVFVRGVHPLTSPSSIVFVVSYLLSCSTIWTLVIGSSFDLLHSVPTSSLLVVLRNRNPTSQMFRSLLTFLSWMLEICIPRWFLASTMHRLLALKRDGSNETHIITFQCWWYYGSYLGTPLERAMKAYCFVFLGLEFQISQATLQSH